MKKVLWVLVILLLIALMFVFDKYTYQTDKVTFIMNENHNLYSERDTLMSFIESWESLSWATVWFYYLKKDNNKNKEVLCIDYNDNEYLYCNFIYTYVPRNEVTKVGETNQIKHNLLVENKNDGIDLYVIANEQRERDKEVYAPEIKIANSILKNIYMDTYKNYTFFMVWIKDTDMIIVYTYNTSKSGELSKFISVNIDKKTVEFSNELPSF